MSCSLTIDAVKSRRKTVTRRHADTWVDLKPGDHLLLVEKAQGLPKGSTQVVLAEVEVISVRLESLSKVDWIECVYEGLPHMTPTEFRAFWCQSHGYGDCDPALRGLFACRRIEWRYLDVLRLDGAPT